MKKICLVLALGLALLGGTVACDPTGTGSSGSGGTTKPTAP
jgi:hypothetical protein